MPLMASVMIALDPCTKANGCLQVIKGSNRVGRIDHGLLAGEQVGADTDRVGEISERLPTIHAEMDPGDALFFHCNTLHRSDKNRSQSRRYTMICCYNAARNNPTREHHHPRYTPLAKVEDKAIKAAGLRFHADHDGDSFLGSSQAPSELARRRARASEKSLS